MSHFFTRLSLGRATAPAPVDTFPFLNYLIYYVPPPIEEANSRKTAQVYAPSASEGLHEWNGSLSRGVFGGSVELLSGTVRLADHVSHHLIVELLVMHVHGDDAPWMRFVRDMFPLCMGAVLALEHKTESTEDRDYLRRPLGAMSFVYPYTRKS